MSSVDETSTAYLPQKATVYVRHKQESFSSTSTVPESWDCIRSNHSLRPGCLKRKSQEESLKCEYASRKSTNAVRWSTVHVYCHTYELGDNPCPLLGPPITIAWQSHKQLEVAVDDFETKHRGTTSRGLLSEDVREYILLNAGYSKRDLSRAIHDARRVRMSRERTQHDIIVNDNNAKKGLFSLWGKKKSATSAKQKKPKTVEFQGPEGTYTVKVR
ncbi:hypothetical protein FisN_19Lh252 [Fistulifera solaris]|uniref:Uncharacterized protein n=1 Tax=Fistulifera solaris TaxID=1519565 RepID=A0A1Z5K7E4_FISSO|nr:hypothetical protein FisN_19Lh252 [Fistulifera solaris]|eukprot:GAX22190.1 hypothetical protein FisN_19Lh252 [Fistulifera solaris]